MKEQELGIRCDDSNPDLSLIEALEMNRQRLGLKHPSFASEVLNCHHTTWWQLRHGSKPGQRFYQIVLVKFPELEAKVYRNMLYWTLKKGEK